MSTDDIHRQAFREEADELLVELESSLLELEDNPENDELINKVFRAMHTLKGSGAMFGFDDVARFTHDVETVFDRVRNGEIKVCKELLDLTLSSCDHVKWLMETAEPDRSPDQDKGPGLLAGLKKFLPRDEEADEPSVALDAGDDDESLPAVFRIRFRPHDDIFSSGNNPLHYLGDLRDLGECRVFAHIEDIPNLAELEPESCRIWWDALLGARQSRQEVEDVFMFVEDICDLAVDEIFRGEDSEAGASYKKLGEILIERGDLDPRELKEALSRQKRLGDLLTEAGLVDQRQVESALAEQKTVKEAVQAQGAARTSSIRVAADKLDFLVDLVGELVIVQSQIKQQVLDCDDVHLKALSEQLERLSDDLRDSTLDIRMLPIGSTFSRFRRLVRDLSADLGKEIDLETSGEETEMDKTVIERLNDPLVHLLRNSIDHGVEAPEAREAAGKPRRGVVRLSAEHSGGEVLIRIEDDGAGMNPRAIRAKAEQKGLVASDAELTDKEIFNLIFLPGFSTAEKVTNVSGRGVGMDVVKRGIDLLRGGVEIDSAYGRGTVITVRLPLTLVIIDGLQVQVGDEYYVLPLSFVEECVGLAHDEAAKGDNRRITNIRGEIVPYVRLRDWFDIQGEAPDIEQIVITGVDGMRVGFVVDRVVGEHQTVIKTLGRLYRDVEGLSGATIKGDGSMALILDVPGLLRAVGEETGPQAAALRTA